MPQNAEIYIYKINQYPKGEDAMDEQLDLGKASYPYKDLQRHFRNVIESKAYIVSLKMT